VLSKRAINRDTFIHPWPEVGLIAIDSPLYPQPSLKVIDGSIQEMDGKKRSEFDMIDQFIAAHAIDLEVAEEAMDMPSIDLACMLVDINIPRQEIARLIASCTPAKIVEIVNQLTVLEMMIALGKMRIRRTPANQAHVTNSKEHPALVAADAAEAALRGFAENETTVKVSRHAPLSALALLVGSQAGRGGVLTQCAVEEALNLRLAMKGLTTYAETLSVYGTDSAFVDGDDTPWSKAFLASAYASRGIKVRFTSGTGSEVLMGHAHGHSMLYLETRCLMVVKGAGSQGVQNGSISCVALPESLPGGVRVILAENLIAAMLGLEVASGNDALASHSDIRKSAKLMLQFIPGTDLITSGYSAVPREDNLFGGGNFDAEDFDDWNVLQRDMQVDGGLCPVRESEVLRVRENAAKAIQAVFEELGFPPLTDEEVEAAIYAHSGLDVPDRDKVADVDAAQAFLEGPKTALDVIQALDARGFREIAERILEMQRQRVVGDYLQPSAIFDEGFHVLSAINDANDYQGPGTGYRLIGKRWEEIVDLPQAADPRQMLEEEEVGPGFQLEEVGPAEPGDGREVVIAVGPAFGAAIKRTIGGLPHDRVVKELIAGINDEGIRARVVKVYRTSDCAFIGHDGALLSGSGAAIGLQSKGTTVIHRRDLNPLDNLELFAQAPCLSLDSYRQIGRNAARYAKDQSPTPVAVSIDTTVRLRLIVKTTLMHLRETRCVVPSCSPMELRLVDCM